MVIVFCKEGQLANRLWQGAHFLANAIEYRYQLLHLGMGNYYPYFSENFYRFRSDQRFRFGSDRPFLLKDRLLLKYLLFSKSVQQRFRYQLPFTDNIYFLDFSNIRYQLKDLHFIKSARRTIIGVDGWFYEDKYSLKKHAAEIKKVFIPNQKYLEKVEHLKREKFSIYDAVIGIHIRRGDYKEYYNGQWYYSDEVYLRFMHEVLQIKQFRNQKIAFFICSNEPLDYYKFKSFNLIHPTGHAVEDLYALAKCDILIGPPSTYTAWASFYGDVPLFHAFEKEQTIKEDSFHVIDYGY